MTTVNITVPSLYGGVSRQPANVRHVNQVQEAENASLSVVDGASKRPGTKLIKSLETFDGLFSSDWRMHTIDRDGSEKYLVIYGIDRSSGSNVFRIRIFKPDGTEAVITDVSKTYTYYEPAPVIGSPGNVTTTKWPTFDSAESASDVVLVTIADYTLIANKKNTLKTLMSPNFTIASTYSNYEAMVTANPANGNYYKTTNASTAHIEGYWYREADGTYTRKPAPMQKDALLDPTKMPFKLVRKSIDPLEFELSIIDWSFRWTGDADTNPVPDMWANGRKISDMTFHRDRLCLVGDEQVLFSQAGDYFNFFIEDHDNLGDADPIETPLNSPNVTLVDFAIPFRKTLVMFTKAGKQFELNAPDTLTPTSASITPSTAYNSSTLTRPKPMGAQIYFASNRQDAGQVYEYLYDDTLSTNVANDITLHVNDYVEGTIVEIVTNPNRMMLITQIEQSNTLYVYQSYWRGTEKVQSAWSKYTFGDVNKETVECIGIIGDTAYMMSSIETGFGEYRKYALHSLSVYKEAAPDGMPYKPLLDYLELVNPTYDAVDNETKWNRSVSSSDTVVLGPAFGVDAGNVVVTNATTGIGLVAKGNYTAGPSYVGRSYKFKVELSRPYVRDQNQQPYIDGVLQLRQIFTLYSNTGYYRIEVQQSGKEIRAKELKPRTIGVSSIGVMPILEEGKFSATVMGKADNTRVFIVNDTPLPCSITSIQWIADFIRRN